MCQHPGVLLKNAHAGVLTCCSPCCNVLVMTNTANIKAAPAEIEIDACFDCASIIANDDDSGCANGDDVRERIWQRWAGYRLVMTDALDEACCYTNDCDLECDTCGRRCPEAQIAWRGVAIREY